MKLLGMVDGTPFPVGYKVTFVSDFFREPVLRQIERELHLIRPEWIVLMCLSYQDGLNSVDICQISEQPSNTVSRAVGSLVRKGLIRREDDPDDARRSLLFIAPEGRELFDRGVKKFVDVEKRVLSRLSDDERDSLDQILAKISKDVSSWAKAAH